jgi:hypothetical protein
MATLDPRYATSGLRDQALQYVLNAPGSTVSVDPTGGLLRAGPRPSPTGGGSNAPPGVVAPASGIPPTGGGSSAPQRRPMTVEDRRAYAKFGPGGARRRAGAGGGSLVPSGASRTRGPNLREMVETEAKRLATAAKDPGAWEKYRPEAQRILKEKQPGLFRGATNLGKPARRRPSYEEAQQFQRDYYAGRLGLRQEIQEREMRRQEREAQLQDLRRQPIAPGSSISPPGGGPEVSMGAMGPPPGGGLPPVPSGFAGERQEAIESGESFSIDFANPNQPLVQTDSAAARARQERTQRLEEMNQGAEKAGRGLLKKGSTLGSPSGLGAILTPKHQGALVDMFAMRREMEMIRDQRLDQDLERWQRAMRLG